MFKSYMPGAVLVMCQKSFGLHDTLIETDKHIGIKGKYISVKYSFKKVG